MRFFSIFFLILFIFVAILFSIKNSEPVIINYYFSSITLPLSIALGLSLLAGALLGIASSLKTIFKLKFSVRKLRKEIDISNKEIANLRSIPIKDKH